MAKVAQTIMWQVPPGKELEFIEITGRAKKIHMRLGAENAILGREHVGENAGQYIYQTHFASAEAYGKFIDAAGADKEWMTLWTEAVKKQVATLSGSRLVVGIDI